MPPLSCHTANLQFTPCSSKQPRARRRRRQLPNNQPKQQQHQPLPALLKHRFHRGQLPALRKHRYHRGQHQLRPPAARPRRRRRHRPRQHHRRGRATASARGRTRRPRQTRVPLAVSTYTAVYCLYILRSMLLLYESSTTHRYCCTAADDHVIQQYIKERVATAVDTSATYMTNMKSQIVSYEVF